MILLAALHLHHATKTEYMLAVKLDRSVRNREAHGAQIIVELRNDLDELL